MVVEGTVNNWICVNFTLNVPDDDVCNFCKKIPEICSGFGMTFNARPLMPVMKADQDLFPDLESCLRMIFFPYPGPRLEGRELDLVIFVMPDNNGSLYADVKRIWETNYGVISEFCLAKHVFEKNQEKRNFYIANLSLKINMKFGGIKTFLFDDALKCRLPFINQQPTIVFGAGVTHPGPGDDYSPSIAAVVASLDWPQATKYAGLVSAQTHRQEPIQDLFKSGTSGMIKDLLESFRNENGHMPKRIIFYRFYAPGNRVSEEQFHEDLSCEIDAIHKACDSLKVNYKPLVTYVVVQKTHHSRLFFRNSYYRGPGTVVASNIRHPTMFDFWAGGIRGTRILPAYYRVQWNDNRFSADSLRTLSNDLCYTHARCTRSASIVPHAYYAHMLALRAKFSMGPQTSDSGKVPCGGSAPPGPDVKPVPALKENKVTFYC